MFKKRSERGQGLAEYQVLFPMGILVCSLLVPAIGLAGKHMYCQAVRVFDPTACEAEVVEFDDVEEIEEILEEDECIVHEMTRGGSQCDQDEDCTLIDLPLNQGTYYSPDREIRSFVIKAGQGYFIYSDGYTPDACYYVEFADDFSSVTWIREGGGKNCKDVSHTEVWYILLCTPE